MTDKLELGIPLTEAENLPEPLLSIVKLLANTRWHLGKDAMNEAIAKSTLDSIRWLLAHRQIGQLPDNTPLYFHELSSWNGATGWWYGETKDGDVYRQRQLWSNDVPKPEKWERVLLGSNNDA